MKLLLIPAFIFLSSCASVYGLKNPGSYTGEELSMRNERMGIPSCNVFGDQYRKDVSSIMQEPGLKKDMLQPLQFWIFKDGMLICNMVNCYASGFPNLNWNIESCYQTKKIYSKTEEPSFSKKFAQVNGLEGIDSGAVMIIDYAYFMGRQNKIFLRNCHEFLAAHREIKCIYNNMDNVLQ